MRHRSAIRFIVLVAFATVISLRAFSATTVESLAHGMPVIASEIGEHSFVPVELEKLSHAKVWYVDYDWHRAHGVEVPAEGLKSKAFRDEILNAYAWQSRMDDDDPNDFTGEKKMAYADYYGGNGAGENHGSGRAAAFGHVQIKGVKTSLAKSKDAWHSNGAVQTIEAVDEAIWSRLLDQEFHQGANKIIAVILTGTYGKMKDGQIFPRALIVREMAVRPAHYMTSPARRYWSTPGDGAADIERVKKSLPGLWGSLPYPKGFKSEDPAEKLRVGFLHLLDLEAQAQAEYVSHRLFFGSYSPSNMEITGRRLDLGDHTAQDGYTPIYRVEHLSSTPFGEITYFFTLFNELRTSLIETMNPELTKTLPTANEVSAEFKARFEFHRAVEFVRLTGVPDEILSQLEATEAVQQLGSIIHLVTQVGRPRKPVFTDPDGWPNTSIYDVNRILTELANKKATTVAAAEDVISAFIDDQGLRNDFAKRYAAFVAAAQAVAGPTITRSALATFMREAAARRNLSRPQLVRGHRRWHELWETTDFAIEHGDEQPTLIQDYIEKRVAENLSDVKTAAPYAIVISETTNSAAGETIQRIFDAKRNQYANVIRIQITNGHGFFRGQKFALAELKSGTVRYLTAHGDVRFATVSVEPSVVTFQASDLQPEDLTTTRFFRASRSVRAAMAPTCQALFN